MTPTSPKPKRLSSLARLWLRLFASLFSRITFPKSADELREALSRGPVVHVFQFAGYLDFLVFNHHLKKQGLPPVAYPRESLWQKIVRRLFGFIGVGARQPARRLENDPRPGEQFVIFLQSPGSFLSVLSGTREIDELTHLLDLQKTSAVPITLMPHLVIWSNRPPSGARSIWDVLFGHALNPGRLRKIIIALRHFRDASLHCGQPIALNEWVRDETGQLRDQRGAVKELRWKLFTFFSEERMAVMGPLTRPRTWILESVLNSEPVQQAIQETAREQGISIKDVTERAAFDLDRMAADYKHDFIRMASVTLKAAFSRLFTHLEIDEEGFERIRELLRRGAVVYVPSHKSHIDYLALSWLLFRHRLVPPHIIAGENLSFWPMGFIFRRMGAIFIKRSFKGNRLYTTLLRQYLQRMLQEGFSQEFFIEGTRSRNGKLQAPKFGLLSVYIDSYLRNPGRELFFVPLSVIYSRVVEESAHVREQHGAEKQKESAKSLLRIFDALKIQHGAMYVRVGEVIPLSSYIESRGCAVAEGDEAARHDLITNLGYDLIARIDRVTTVTPSSVVALALLCGSRKGIAGKKLRTTIDIIIHHLRVKGAPFAKAFDDTPRAISEVLSGLQKDKSIKCHRISDEWIYTIDDNNRTALDYYKNYILHEFANTCLFSQAFLSCRQEEATSALILERAQALFEFFRHEINFSPFLTLESLFAATRDYFLAENIWREVRPGVYGAGEKQEELLFFGHLFDSFIESYWVVAATSKALVGKRISQKRFFKLIMDEGRKLSLTGEIERQEAYSRSNFQNAVSAFATMGVLVRFESEDDTTQLVLPKDMPAKAPAQKAKSAKKRQVFYELSEAYNHPERITDFSRRIRSHLVR